MFHYGLFLKEMNAKIAIFPMRETKKLIISHKKVFIISHIRKLRDFSICL